VSAVGLGRRRSSVPDVTDVESGELDEAMAAVVEEYVAEGLPSWHALSVSGARDLEAELFGGGDAPEMAAVRDIAIDGPGGDLPIRVYRPERDDANTREEPADDPPGALVFLHGGLFVLGTLDSADDICRELAARTGCVVCSVDYRLAPEHPFPAAVEDAHSATQWVREHATSLGVDASRVDAEDSRVDAEASRVGVVGSSAGGALAAATALHAAETDAPLAVQAMLYPMLDPAVAHAGATSTAGSTGSNIESGLPAEGADAEIPDAYREHADAALLDAADVAWGWRQYLRSPVDAHNPHAAPGGADPDLLADTAPAVVATAGVDVLRDDGAAYANRLADAGVDVTHAHYPTLAHGFASLTDDVPLAAEALDEVADAIRTHLA
jgi:acetyl esterase